MKSNFNDQVYNSKSMQEIPFMHKQSLAENIGFQKLKDTVLSSKKPWCLICNSQPIQWQSKTATTKGERIQTDCQTPTEEKEQYWSM